MPTILEEEKKYVNLELMTATSGQHVIQLNRVNWVAPPPEEARRSSASGSIELAKPAEYVEQPFSAREISSQLETMSLLAGRIVREIGVLGGRPHIRNTRVPVSVILGGLAEGMSPEELTRAFPPLTLEDIRATLAYAAIEFALTH